MCLCGVEVTFVFVEVINAGECIVGFGTLVCCEVTVHKGYSMDEVQVCYGVCWKEVTMP